MVLEYKGEEFLTDNDLQIVSLGRYPEIIIEDSELREKFLEEYVRNFLGGDEIISHRQLLVAKGMKFDKLEEEILSNIKDPDKPKLRQYVADKIATSIARGHSMGGLSGVVLGIHGTKMIDSGLTGLVASRSLVTSGRRRTVKESDLVVPESISQREELLKEYLEISKTAFTEAGAFKEKFGKLDSVEAFNKALPYNNPADLLIALPLDTMATLAFEVRRDNHNPKGPFLPREIHELVKRFPEITEENGMGEMYRQRIQVPRGTYLHYNVFKDPDAPNYANELALEFKFPDQPVLVSDHKDRTYGFIEGIYQLKGIFQQAREETDPERLVELANRAMDASQELTREYNEAIGATILDPLSFRVWSEQKRHATLRQNVESIYTAAKRATEIIKKFWPKIEDSYNGTRDKDSLPISELEKAIVIDKRLKQNPELLIPYVYHSGRQLMFFDKLVREGIPMRDAAFMIPRDVVTYNLEHYDLINLIDLELPLRLCRTCEPERHSTSWKKRKLLARAFPDLVDLLQPKCSVGVCNEANYCAHINRFREYDQDLHTQAKEAMLRRTREN
jgi:hypothetical protein